MQPTEGLEQNRAGATWLVTGSLWLLCGEGVRVWDGGMRGSQEEALTALQELESGAEEGLGLNIF